jgi:hypothetical protein
VDEDLPVGALAAAGGQDQGAGLELEATAPYAATVEARTPYLSPSEAEVDQVGEMLADAVLAPLEGGGR